VSTVHLVVPEAVDDPERPSGGNTYDRRVAAGLSACGWTVHRHVATGDWPSADRASRSALTAALAGMPDDAVVLLDGLVASAVPEVLVPEGRRLRLVVLVHLPLGVGSTGGRAAEQISRECVVLAASVAVVVTSRWTRQWLLSAYGLEPGRVHVVVPGVDQATVVPRSVTGERLVCVGALTHVKGPDVLVEALAEVADLGWSCTCMGSMAVDAAYAEHVRRRSAALGLHDRVAFTGPLVGSELDAGYATADLVVAPSRTETYGMAVAEALARGIPVVGSDVGGLPEALGRSPDGCRPGILVPAGDTARLADALRCWLTDAGLRADLRRAARARRATLTDWSVTAERLSGILEEVAA
jgi:glycosyltransferase involved in cell wall biosynthesis